MNRNSGGYWHQQQQRTNQNQNNMGYNNQSWPYRSPTGRPTSSSTNFESYNPQLPFQRHPVPLYNSPGYYASPPISPDLNVHQPPNNQNQSPEFVPHNPFHSSNPKQEKDKTEPKSFSQIQELEQKIQNLEQQLKNSLAGYQRDFSSVCEENKKIGDKNQVLFQKNENLEAKVLNLETKLKKAQENSKSEFAALRKDVTKWKTKFNQEERQCLQLFLDKNVLVGKVKESDEEIRVLNEKVKTVENAKQRYSNDVTELVHETERLNQVLKDNAAAHEKELESQKKEYTDKIAEYCELVDKLKKNCSDFSIQVENLTLEKSEVLVQLDKAKEQNSGVCKQMENLNQENSSLLAEIERREQEKSSHLIQIEKLKQEKSNVSIEMEKVKQENASLSMQMESIQQQNSDLSVQLENLKQENEDLSIKLKTERPERIKCIKGCECEEEILDLWSNYRRVEKEKRKLNKKLEGITDELVSQQKRCHKLEKKLKRRKKERSQRVALSSKATQVENEDTEEDMDSEAEVSDVVFVQQDNENNSTCATVENKNEEIIDGDKEIIVSNLKRKLESFKNLRPQLRKMMDKDNEIFTQLEKRMKAFELEAEVNVRNPEKDNDDNVDDSENEQVEEITGAENHKMPCLFRPPLSKLNN